MQIFVDTVEEYIFQIPEERKKPFRKLLETVDTNLPKGFIKNTKYGMVIWCVPLETYPAVIIVRKILHFLSLVWLLKRILWPFTIWEFMLNQRFWNGLSKKISETFQKETGYGKILH